MGSSGKCAVGCGRPARRHRMCADCWHEAPTEFRHAVVVAFQEFKEAMRSRRDVPRMRDRARAYRMARDAAIGSIR